MSDTDPPIPIAKSLLESIGHSILNTTTRNVSALLTTNSTDNMNTTQEYEKFPFEYPIRGLPLRAAAEERTAPIVQQAQATTGILLSFAFYSGLGLFVCLVFCLIRNSVRSIYMPNRRLKMYGFINFLFC